MLAGHGAFAIVYVVGTAAAMRLLPAAPGCTGAPSSRSSPRSPCSGSPPVTCSPGLVGVVAIVWLAARGDPPGRDGRGVTRPSDRAGRSLRPLAITGRRRGRRRPRCSSSPWGRLAGSRRRPGRELLRAARSGWVRQPANTSQPPASCWPGSRRVARQPGTGRPDARWPGDAIYRLPGRAARPGATCMRAAVGRRRSARPAEHVPRRRSRRPTPAAVGPAGRLFFWQIFRSISSRRCRLVGSTTAGPRS